MEDKVLNLTQKIEKKRKKRKIWKNIFTSLAVIVVFCTTYALILPAITKSRTSHCGHEEHTHEEACYSENLICSLSEELALADPEVEYHTHDESCYQEKTELICSITQEEGHIHTDECREMVSVNQCGLEESDEHTHTEECFEEAATIICGQEETPASHIHEEGCYETSIVLVCEKEEITLPDAHVHGEECYEQVLTCELKEHTHELICFSDPNADLETEEDWEATIPKELTGVWADDLLAIAKSQLGYQESIENYAVVEDEEKGYTRYGEWYGDKYGDWCAMFASFCLNYAEIPENVMGFESNCQNWVEKLQERDLEAEKEIAADESANDEETAVSEISVDTTEEKHQYYKYTGTYIPKPGDLVFFEVSKEDWANHVGIVTEVILTEKDSEADAEKDSEGEQKSEEEQESLGQIKTIEGNASDAVSERTYALEDTSILGYGVLPENPDYVPPVEEGEDGSTEMTEDGTSEEFSGETSEDITDDETSTEDDEASTEEPFVETPAPEEILITRQTITAVIYTDETMEQIAEEDTTVITITGLLPENVTAKAYPVVLEDTVVDGKNLVFAYDITLYDKDGVLIENQESEYPITVTIEPAEWGEGSQDTNPEDYQIYYIPEEGEPEPMETEGSEDAVSFTTDHFSVYALAVKGSSLTVYLNGVSGNDGNNGTATNRAVKSFEAAAALVKEGGTIYITGTVTMSGETELGFDKTVTVKRNSGFTGPLITVPSGGNLILSNVTINGGSEKPTHEDATQRDKFGTVSTYASNSAEGPIINVESGGKLQIKDGTKLEYNSNKPDTNTASTSTVEDGYKGLGGAIYCQGDLTMSGGLIQYCEAEAGGGIYIESANKNRITFDFTGGTIDHNYARDIITTSKRLETAYHKNAGGGIYVGNYVTMNMSGGTISNNQTSREGGGVSLGWLNRNASEIYEKYITTFNMTGGTFTGNAATSTGGALNITAGREAYISAGTFTDNRANGKEYQPGDNKKKAWNVYSGGAIYLDADPNADQYDNKNNPDGMPGYAVINRVVITRNNATDAGGGIACCSTSSGSVGASVKLEDGTAIFENTAPEYYSYYDTYYYGNEMYIAGKINLETDYILGSNEQYEWQTWSESAGYVYYDNSLKSSDSTIINALKLYSVMISDNTGYLGGGIGCNGKIEIGGISNTTSIKITKKWNDDGTVKHPDSITVQIYQDGKKYGNPITIKKVIDATGKESWPTYYLDNLPANHTYTIKEITIPGYTSVVDSNGNNFTITNTYLSTDISVEKQWIDGENNTPGVNEIKVNLLANGVIKETIPLNNDNEWYHLWENLPLVDENDGDITYSVEEIPIPGYESETTYTEKTEGGETVTKWIEVEDGNITKSGTYLLVASQGVLASKGTGNNQLQWLTDKDKQLLNPDNIAQWTYDGSKFKNENGRYLRYSNSRFELSTSTNYSNIKLSNNNLVYSNNYYFTGINKSGSNAGYGSASSKSGSALEFTAYKKTDVKTDVTKHPHYIITNTKKNELDLNFAKYSVTNKDQDKLSLIAGAKLVLYRQDASSATTIPGTEVKGIQVDEWISETSSGNNGTYHKLTLSDGVYYLIETEVPEGHIGLKQPIIFEVDSANSNITIQQYPDYKDVELEIGEDGTKILPIYNSAAYELPETGNIGSAPYAIIGTILFMTVGLFLLYYDKIKEYF